MDTVVFAVAVEDVAGLAAGVSVAVAAHDVAELDAAGFAVPETSADEEESEDAKGDGESDDEGIAFGGGAWGVGVPGGLGD